MIGTDETKFKSTEQAIKCGENNQSNAKATKCNEHATTSNDITAKTNAKAIKDGQAIKQQ